MTGTGGNIDANTIITGRGGIDLITPDSSGTDVVEIVTTTGQGSGDGDVITNFTTAEDILRVDLSDLEALASVTDLVNLDGGSMAAGAVVLSGDIAPDLVNGTGDEVLQIDNDFASAAALETLLEAGGAEAITVNGALEAGDAFLMLTDDGTDSYLYAIATDRAVADDGNFVAGSLTAELLATFDGIADATAGFADADIVIIA